MLLSLSIKNVPSPMVRALRTRAAANHRSLQGELMSILEEAVRPKTFDAKAVRARARALGLSSGVNESTAIVRELRDSR
jgi:plasmid stability protein